MTASSILVTGANGLLGKSVAGRLAASGQIVVGMDLKFSEQSNFPTVQADINDIHRLDSTLKKFSVSQIVHCGAISGRVVAADSPFQILETNVRGTSTIFEAARVAGVSRVVFCSSAAAYGNQIPAVLTEDQPLNATTVYGASKACGEAIMRAYAAQYGLQGVALRIFQVYGPRRTTECYIRLMIENALADRPTSIPQAAQSRRQYVYADDVVDAILLALKTQDLPRPAYNICGDSSLTLAEVADIVASIVPGVKVTFGENPKGEQYKIEKVDLSVARAELGYYPKVSLRDGIARYAKWLEKSPLS